MVRAKTTTIQLFRHSIAYERLDGEPSGLSNVGLYLSRSYPPNLFDIGATPVALSRALPTYLEQVAQFPDAASEHRDAQLAVEGLKRNASGNGLSHESEL